MGCQSSCLLPAARQPTALLLSPDGDLRRVAVPAGAAELMLESPGYVVAVAEELRRTRRVIGMRADEQLRPGEAYVLLPARLVGCRVSDRQMSALVSIISGQRGKRRIKNGSGSGGRVFPEMGGEKEEEKVAPVVHQRTGSYRQYWRPVLDTIRESPARP